MADSESTARQRKPKEASSKLPDEPTEKPKAVPLGKKAKDEDDYSPWLDVVRVLTFLLLASSGLSYLVSSGESFFWSMKVPPKYLQKEWWTDQFVRPPTALARTAHPFRNPLTDTIQRGPIQLTPAELATYDGTDASKPLYLAINGTIYDVTPGARMYGPGGSYHWFAGVDAARAYVTGCFSTDRTPDMRGVEDMFLPLDDPAVDRLYTAAEMRALREEELARARKQVHDGLKHWVDFFANSKKYHRVGTVKRPADWLEKEPRKQLCEVAAKGRKARDPPKRE